MKLKKNSKGQTAIRESNVVVVWAAENKSSKTNTFDTVAKAKSFMDEF